MHPYIHPFRSLFSISLPRSTFSLSSPHPAHNPPPFILKPPNYAIMGTYIYTYILPYISQRRMRRFSHLSPRRMRKFFGVSYASSLSFLQRREVCFFCCILFFFLFPLERGREDCVGLGRLHLGEIIMGTGSCSARRGISDATGGGILTSFCDRSSF